jgi:hypothetical protein
MYSENYKAILIPYSKRIKFNSRREQILSLHIILSVSGTDPFCYPMCAEVPLSAGKSALPEDNGNRLNPQNHAGPDKYFTDVTILLSS